MRGFFFAAAHADCAEAVISELCITVIGKDAESIRRARVAAEATADLVELRLDSMGRPDAAAALQGRTSRAIATCRPLREGGMFDGPEEDRLRILADAHALGAEFIDLEWDAVPPPFVRERGGRGIVLSRHVFDCTPRNAAAILDYLRGKDTEIAKLAVMTERIADLRTLLQAARPDNSSILIGMGSAGLATRVLAARYGSRWTYAGNGVAPGQVPATRLVSEFHFSRIRRDADIYALIGRPAARSLSPAMHNAGFAALGINAVYVPLETRDLDELRLFAAEAGIRGASVTIPFKQDVMPLVDEMAPTAAGAGAVNTIAIRDGRWIGSNTDADGFMQPLRDKGIELRARRAVILGAGGAARGVGLALRREGARVGIAARRRDAARSVADAIGGEPVDWPPRAGSWDVLINATPVGSRGTPGTPFDGPFDGQLVYDLVYDPDPTALMKAAAEHGVETIGGLAMLVAQAERQFEIWTGQPPPAGLFLEAATAAMSERERNGAAGEAAAQ